MAKNINLGRSAALATLVISIALLFPTVNADDTTERHVPPPLPEHKWVGKTGLNYTTLHNEFVETLVCSYIPFGVLGYYVWLLSTAIPTFLTIQVMRLQFLVLFSVMMSEGADDPDMPPIPATPAGASTAMIMIPAIRTILVGIVHTAWNIFTLVLYILTFKECDGAMGFAAMRNPFILATLASGVLAIAGIASIIFASAVMFREKRGKSIAAAWTLPGITTTIYVGIVTQLIVGTMYFFSVTRKADILHTVFRHSDSVSSGQFAVCCIIPIIAFLVRSYFVFESLKGLPKDTIIATIEGLFRSFKIVEYIVAMFFGVSMLLLCVGGHVLFGNIVGDPWGGYLVKRALGKAIVALIVTFPALQTTFVFW